VPELPDITVYREALERRVAGRVLEGVSVASPFLLRTVEPPLTEAVGHTVLGIERIGKRLVFALEGELFLVLHLMIAGRLKWFPPAAKGPGRITLARFDFPGGRLVLTEAGTKRRASLHVVRGREALRAFDRGGIEPLEASLPEFAARLRLENHTVKRALTDPRLFSGIGNAYSDEILHAAGLSPLALTRKLSDDQIARLFAATRETLEAWIVRIRADTGAEFPEKVTAFREGMAVHGRFGQPCPTCGSPVQRIRYADNETNYCARCQTDGKLLADRALSRLLKSDWPRTLDELE
jgi:formamidopyrimidine-DNA glycosylase